MPGREPGRFGAFSGVFTPSVLTIIGVIMYLRFGWVVGSVGLAGALAIVCLAHVISFITAMSVASIATNRRVGAGGAYFMISRSLGAPTGAAIGIPLFFAQALSVSFYVVGFIEVIQMLAPQFDGRLIGVGTCIALALISVKSADIAIRVQFLIMTFIALSIISLFLGTGDNSTSAYPLWITGQASFATVFAVFFPAVTGIMAGISMSGDLKDPRRDLPLGTLAAVFLGFILYLVIPIWLAKHASPEELRTDMQIFWKISKFPELIYAGVLGATLSSAIGCILTAPRTLQAIAADGLAPAFLAQGAGPNNEPRIGLLVTTMFAVLGILVGNLDTIARILTMFFLATYGMTNLACFLERWAASPSFRPDYAVPWLVSLLGAIACFYVMSLIDMPAMLAALAICALIFIYAKRRSLQSDYGDARHGIWAALVRSSLLRLKRVEYHPHNWRPNLIVFGGDFHKRNYLMKIGLSIAGDSGMVTFFHLLQGHVRTLAPERLALQTQLRSMFEDRFPNAFCRVDIVPDVHSGIPTMAQSYGMGTFEANTVLLGWTEKPERLAQYMGMLRDLLELDRSLLLLNYKHDRGFGQARHIDIWWGGMTGNGAMMLLTAYLLTNHAEWRGATVRLITIVSREDQRAKAESVIEGILAQTRVDAMPHILVRGDKPVPAIMEEQSIDTDLALVGIRLPESPDSDQSFFDRFQDFLHILPTTLLVSSAQNFEGLSLLLEEDPDASP